MEELTTGQVARAAGLSERAVRLYADSGLLLARRSTADGRRMLESDQVERARLVRLLRGLGLSLVEIDAVLSDAQRVARFDAIWSARRRASVESAITGEYARSVLLGEPELGRKVDVRNVEEQLILVAQRSSTLRELPRTIAETTEQLFMELANAEVDLAGPPFVTYHERATDGFAARVSVATPISGLLRPPPGLSISVCPAHAEAFVELNGAESQRQDLIVIIHDHLTSGRLPGRLRVVGDSREVYLPAWGDEGAAPVMEIAVPVASCNAATSSSI